MNKGIHKDFLICADAMWAVFNSIEENKAWNLMPEFLPELAPSPFASLLQTFVLRP